MSKALHARIPVFAGAFCLLFTSGLGAVPSEAYRSYARGLLAAKAGDLESALHEYERVTSLDRDAVLVYRDLAFLYWQTGRSEEAFNAAEKLNELNGDPRATQLFLGSFYLLAGQSNRARQSWERALKIDAENETALLYLAAYHSSDNDPRKAVTYWNKYLEKDPLSAEGYYQLGMAQEKLGQVENAREAFLKAVSLKPEGVEAHIALAQLYEKEEKIVAAAQEYERYLELVPDNMNVLLYLGGLYYRAKNYPAAENIFLRAQALNPRDDTIHFWLGIISEEKKDWDGAIRYFSQISTREENPVILTRLGYYHSAKKDSSEAVKQLKKVVKLEPNNPNSYYLLGLAYFDLKKYRPAEENFRKALERKPDMEEVYFHLGVLYDQWGKFDRAVPELEKAIELNPRYSQALNYLGYSYADRNRELEEAESLVLRALELEPENGSYLDSLGWVHYHEGRYADAETALLKAAGKFSDPVIWEHLGDARLKMDKTSEAWDAYQKARELNPGDKKIRDKIRKLEKRVLPSTLQRKVLKRAVGNLLQVSSLRLNYVVAGESKSINFRIIGVLQYARPDRWRLDVLGNFLAPQLVIIENRGLSFYPASLGENLAPGTVEMLGRVKDFFNGDLLEEFDSEQAASEARGCFFLYRLGDKTLVIDRRSGTVAEYRVGKDLVLRFRKYTQEEGLFLPGRIDLYSKPDALSASVQLHHLAVNSPVNENAFTLQGISHETQPDARN
ncbi:MAG: tetratricopeptide repeat protein [Endomicrobiales bacterium]